MVKMEITRFPLLDYQAKEAVNTLCANLSFAGGDIKKIMITSCHPQEGKSFISMNLMRALAAQGMKVVLVDSDIRASRIQGTYGIKFPDTTDYPGLTKYLSGQCSIDMVLGETNIPNAYMILAGKTVTNSLPLISKPRLGQLLDALSKKFDIVIVDASPVGTIIDAAKISLHCDGTLFVVQSGSVTRQELDNALKQMEKTGVPILGMILNKFDDSKYGNKYYSKGSYYSNYYTGRKSKKS